MNILDYIEKPKEWLMHLRRLMPEMTEHEREMYSLTALAMLEAMNPMLRKAYPNATARFLFYLRQPFGPGCKFPEDV